MKAEILQSFCFLHEKVNLALRILLNVHLCPALTITVLLRIDILDGVY